jgi:hypothetical protein
MFKKLLLTLSLLGAIATTDAVYADCQDDLATILGGEAIIIIVVGNDRV